jgi:hypothetical protein
VFLLGIVGLLQMTTLPGLLVLKASHYKCGFIQSVALCFTLSLLSNYLIASALVFLGLYTTWVVRAGVLIETGVVIWLYRSFLDIKLGQGIRSIWDNLVNEIRSHLIDLNDDSNRGAVIKILLFVFFVMAFLLASNSIAWALRIYKYNLGKVFGTWDAVFSWNPWAVIWATGKLPGNISYYPQLIPANWSMIYLLQNDSSIQLFAKSVMPLFFLLTLLLVFDLGWDLKSIGILLGVVVLQLMDKKFLGEFLADGYVDIPVAFLSFFSVYLLLKLRKDQDIKSYRLSLWFSALAAATGALTKQPVQRKSLTTFSSLFLLGFSWSFRSIFINIWRLEWDWTGII